MTMRPDDKQKEQLINKLKEMRQRIIELEDSEYKHKETERMLRESEERYRRLFADSPIGVGIASLDGKIIDINKIVENITGYSLEEFKEINISDIYENRKDREALLRSIDRYGIVTNFTVRLKHKDGTLYDALLNVTRVHLEGQDVLQTTIVDITERIKMQKTLRESEEKYRTIFEQAADSIVLIDADTGALVDFNDKTHENLGYSRKEFEKLTRYSELLSAEEPAKIAKNIGAMMRLACRATQYFLLADFMCQYIWLFLRGSVLPSVSVFTIKR